MSRVGIVSNANCRDNRRGVGDDERFVRIVGDRGVVTVTRSNIELERAIERYREARIELLGIHGGDGTIHHTLTALIRGYRGQPLPRLLLLRGGTMNTLAHGLGIKGRRGAATALLTEVVACLDADAAPRITRRFAVRVGDRYGLIFGNGIMYSFAKEYYGRGTPQPWTAAQLLTRVVGSALTGGRLATRLLQPFTARVVADGVTLPQTRFLTIAVASVPEAGYGFAMLPHAVDGLEGLAITAIHTSPRALVAEMPKMLLRQPLRPDRCTLDVARSFTIEADTAVGYTLDGDCYVDGPHVEISAGPHVEIVLPSADRRAA